MRLYYVLDEAGEPYPVDDVLAWAQWFETATRQIAHTQIGPYRISTVFLGIDHNHLREVLGGPPLLWETMVFVGDGAALDVDMRRYTSRTEALEGHRTTCQLVALEVERQEGKLPVAEELEKH